jgi:Ni/Fe-hydrogenase 1 B-type cytochrome subunit
MDRQYDYVWSVTYRVDHWVRVVALIVSIFTGFYIHWPFLPGGAEGGFAVMSWMQFAHFVSAYIIILGLIVRIYLAFKSTFDADWRDFGMGRILKNIPDALAYYLFLKDTHKRYRRYNALQALTYLFWAYLIVFMALTGFALYRGTVFGFIQAPDAFQWVNTLLGGEPYTRIWHFLGMWVFLITAAVHVYMAVLASLVQRDQTFYSMISGYKLRVERDSGKLGQ